MPFETYKDLTGAGLRQTTYGPGSPNPTRADLREFTGLNDQRLRSGDAGLPRDVARRYGLNVGDPFQFGGKTYTYRDQPNTRVGNVLDVYYPKGGQQVQSAGNVTDNPFAGGMPRSVPDTAQPIGGIDLPPTSDWNEPTTAPYNPAFEMPNMQGPPQTYEAMAPTGPNEFIPSEAGANIPTNEFMQPMGSEFYPSENLNIPTNETMTPSGDQYRGVAPANVPTSETMAPTGPNDFLPSAGANIPTNEAMYPTDLQQYLPSDAGANIPTDESMTATLAPDAFGMSEAPATFAYPSGDGTYTTLDASTGQPVAAAPAQPTFDVNYNPADTGPLYGDQKKPTTFFQDLGADVTDIGNVLGTGTPINTALSGQPGFGAHPSSYTGPGGGAFWTPAGGIPLGPLGQGSQGMIPWEYYARMARARMMKGGDPTLGLGELNTPPGAAIARFQAGGTGYGGTNMMGGYGIRGRGGRVASSYVNPNFYAPGPVPEPSSQKPGGGAAAGGIGGGGPGGIP